jgi:galactokinase
MDPMAASLAEVGAALFLDARSLDFERIPLPSVVDLVVIHCGISHNLVAGDYNLRRQECEQASALLNVTSLREVGLSDLPHLRQLPDPLGRRVSHVVTENDRVLQAVAALRVADLSRLGRLFYESHDSMRDDYEVSIPEIDLLVDLARTDARVFGARLTGGGFGGSIVALARAGEGKKAAERLAREYQARSAHTSRILVPQG